MYSNYLFNREYIAAVDPLRPINKFYHYEKFLDAIGIPRPTSTPTKLTFPATPKQSQIFIVFGSSWITKNWFAASYVELIEAILGKNLAVTLVGSDAEMAKNVMRSLSDDRLAENVNNLVGQTSISQLCSIINASLAGIGPDSGPGHIASALGIPYISMFGPTDPRLVAPVGSEHLVITSGVGCSPCYKRQCPGLHEVCMRNITAQMVQEKLFNLLQIQ